MRQNQEIRKAAVAAISCIFPRYSRVPAVAFLLKNFYTLSRKVKKVIGEMKFPLRQLHTKAPNKFQSLLKHITQILQPVKKSRKTYGTFF
jgi:hypothetical protein